MPPYVTTSKAEEARPLAEDYRADLALLRGLYSTILTPRDIGQLQSIAIKYGIDTKIKKKNFNIVLGQVSFRIRRNLEKLVIEDMLDSARQMDPEKIPKKTKQQTQKVPEVLLD